MEFGKEEQPLLQRQAGESSAIGPGTKPFVQNSFKSTLCPWNERGKGRKRIGKQRSRGVVFL